jgi:hypothetical protein
MNTITYRMSGDEAALWTAISTFEIDGADTTLTFAARLARENGWDTAYTQRVLAEYRRFLFLCCHTETGVTPSDAVDQAWHLHLTYTRSYWIDLCRNTLGRDLHHNPTKGGGAEGKKFDEMYSETARLYQHVFGEAPPPDIWPSNAQRFGDIDFERVNRRTHWVLPKPALLSNRMSWISLLLVAMAFLFVQATGSVVVVLSMAGAALMFLLINAITAASESDSRKRPSEDDGSAFVGDTGTSHGGGHSHGDGGDASGGDSGCSSGCSGCSGCGGGCGGG